MKTLELDISFGRDYFARHFGLKYEDAYFDDVAVRAETDMRARQALHDRFGDVGLGVDDPEPEVQLGYDDTLNVALMFGGRPCVGAGISWVEPGFLDMDAVDSLQVPDVAGTWPHTRFLEQYEEAARRFGSRCVRPPVAHGILEQGLDLCGDSLLAEMALNPARAARLFDVLAETVVRVKEYWDRVCFGEVRPGLSLGGCSTTMLSPAMVATLLAPRYERIATHFGAAFLCTCGVTTQHLEIWAGLRGVRSVRCGWGTDLERAAQVLRHRHVKAALDVLRAAELSAAAIAADTRWLLDTLLPVNNVSVLLIHASDRTPDANVRRIIETVFAFAAEHNIILNSTSSCQPPARSPAG